jgi:phage protein D
MVELQPLIEGEITKISPSFPEDGVPTVAIEGQTCLHRLNGDCKTRNFQKMTDTEIAQQIAQDSGLDYDAEDTHIRHDYIMQPNQTDLQFLRDRAALIQFEILVEGKKLIFRKVKEGAAKVYTLVWAQPQKGFTTDSTFPLKTFSLQMDAKKPANTVKLLSYDPATKQTLVSTADSSDQTHTMGGASKGSDVCSQAFGRPKEFVGVAVPFATQAEGDQKAKAILNQQAMGLVGGSAETIGLPDLRSGKIVELKGVGTRFEGLYCVDEATHSIDGNGYLTSFTVKRNSVS